MPCRLLLPLRGLAALVGLLVVAGSNGCGGEKGGEPIGDAARAAESEQRETTMSAVRTAEVPDSPCDWIPAPEVAAILGPLDGTPERIRDLENETPAPDGTACRYRIAARRPRGTSAVHLQVTPSGGVLYERTVGAMQEHFAAALGDGKPAGNGEPTRAPGPDAGWDYSGHLPAGQVSYTGRLGHVAVDVVSQSPDVPRDKLATLARQVRERVPDLPFALPPDPVLEELKRMDGGEPEPPPSGPDPCGLLTRAETEAVLGKLVVEPYRSNENTPLADPHGKGCTYFTAGHHTLVLVPLWDSGKEMFAMARAVGGTVAPTLPEADPDRESADTLDGPWDAAAGSGVTGDLYFLKGDRMLQLGYLTSSTDLAGAVRLARIAVERL